MKKILNIGLALTLLTVGSISASAQNLYISDSSGHLGYVNLATDKVTIVGSFGSGLRMTSIGFANGNLYGETGSSLYSISLSTGLATAISTSYGTIGGGTMKGLTNYGTNLIAGSTSTPNLYVVDTSPLVTSTLVGSLTADQVGGLTFANNGLLYDVVSKYTLDKVTVAGVAITSTAVGNLTLNGINVYGIGGLATEPNGTVVAVAGTQIYTVDLANASLTSLFNFSGTSLASETGAAINYSPLSLSAVPEPRNILLLLAGLAGLFFYQKRRSVGNVS
jgi:hypothetical protein